MTAEMIVGALIFLAGLIVGRTLGIRSERKLRAEMEDLEDATRENLSTREVALMLKMSVSGVNALIREKSLKAVKQGRRWRVDKKDVEEFMTRQKLRVVD